MNILVEISFRELDNTIQKFFTLNDDIEFFRKNDGLATKYILSGGAIILSHLLIERRSILNYVYSHHLDLNVNIAHQIGMDEIKRIQEERKKQFDIVILDLTKFLQMEIKRGNR